MKNVIVKIIILFLSVGMAGVAGCSSKNTQSQNTTIGAVSGGVIGGIAGSAISAGTGQVVAIAGGAIVGALIGGYVGHDMDSSDKTTMHQAMDTNPPNKRTKWTNKSTKTSYMVVPTSKMMTVKGNPNCREFRTMITVDGKSQTITGMACREADGTWKKITA